jgi:hypothetical protein
LEKRTGIKDVDDQYHSVEFSIKGFELPYQVRIWENSKDFMNILVKEGSSVLPLLKVGDTLNTKYYTKGSVYPSENMRTVIRHIKKNNKGRLKGHYLIGLKIVED